MAHVKSASMEMVSRILTWLKAQGIHENEQIIRHVLGIVKSSETRTTIKR